MWRCHIIVVVGVGIAWAGDVVVSKCAMVYIIFLMMTAHDMQISSLISFPIIPASVKSEVVRPYVGTGTCQEPGVCIQPLTDSTTGHSANAREDHNHNHVPRQGGRSRAGISSLRLVRHTGSVHFVL